MSTNSSEDPKLLTPIRFHYFRLKFTPYSHIRNQTSDTILNQVITFLSQQRQEGKGFLIDKDKHESRTNDAARPLFVTSTTMMFREKRIRCSIALLRTGKIPFVKPSDKFMLVPYDTSNGQIAEQTHFFIDYNTDTPILCVEYNYNSPRVSDIEYYLRIVAATQKGIKVIPDHPTTK